MVSLAWFTLAMKTEIYELRVCLKEIKFPFAELYIINLNTFDFITTSAKLKLRDVHFLEKDP